MPTAHSFKPSTFDRLETGADEAIAVYGCDMREAVKALIVANEFLEGQLAELQAAVSNGYARRRFELSLGIAKIGTTDMSEVTYYVSTVHARTP